MIVDFAGVDTTADAFRTIRPGGRVVQVGIGLPTATINLMDVLVKQIDYCGSIVGNREDLAAFLDLCAKGKVHPHVEDISFNEIGRGIGRLQAGGVVGRLVATSPA